MRSIIAVACLALLCGCGGSGGNDAMVTAAVLPPLDVSDPVAVSVAANAVAGVGAAALAIDNSVAGGAGSSTGATTGGSTGVDKSMTYNCTGAECDYGAGTAPRAKSLSACSGGGTVDGSETQNGSTVVDTLIFHACKIDSQGVTQTLNGKLVDAAQDSSSGTIAFGDSGATWQDEVDAAEDVLIALFGNLTYARGQGIDFHFQGLSVNAAPVGSSTADRVVLGVDSDHVLDLQLSPAGGYNNNVWINGPLSVAHSGSTTRCPGGSMSIATNQSLPLNVDSSGNIVGGEITVSAGAGTAPHATVDFNSDGSMTVTPAGATQSSTYPKGTFGGACN